MRSIFFVDGKIYKINELVEEEKMIKLCTGTKALCVV